MIVDSMLALFRQKPAPPSVLLHTTPKGLLRPEPATSLLATPRRQKLLEHIWQRTSLSRAQFASLYGAPIERYAVLVQQFPASESHHHAYAGGMLDHGLEIVAYALRLRQSHLLPVGAPPETQAAQAEAWTAGTAYAALLHDIGKIAVDLHVEHDDGSRWFPWHGPLQRAYRFRYRKDRAYRLHSAAAGLLYTDILDPSIMDWLSGFPDLWAALLYVLAGQYEHAGILGELVTQADQASVAQDLGGDPEKARAAPKQALPRKLIDGLRFLIKEQLRLNQPQASDGWLTQDALWLVSKTVCDRLRAHLLAQGIEGIPEQNTTLFNVLQENGIVQATLDGKAIWRATVASESGWSNSFTFLRLAPALIWETGDLPPPFNGTVHVEQDAQPMNTDRPTTANKTSPSAEVTSAQPARTPVPSTTADLHNAVDDVLELLGGASLSTSESDPAPVDPASVPTPHSSHVCLSSVDDGPTAKPNESTSAHFITWLRDSIASRHLIINDARALVHTVAGTAFLVSPGVFQRYVQEHPEIAEAEGQQKMALWECAQKSFEQLHLHRKQPGGLNIWTCAVTGQRKSRRLHGYLLADGHYLFPTMPLNNPYLTLVTNEKPHRTVAA